MKLVGDYLVGDSFSVVSSDLPLSLGEMSWDAPEEIVRLMMPEEDQRVRRSTIAIHRSRIVSILDGGVDGTVKVVDELNYGSYFYGSISECLMLLDS